MIEFQNENNCPRPKMPYIAANGEIYEDEEIYGVEVEEEADDVFSQPEDVVMHWEKRLML